MQDKQRVKIPIPAPVALGLLAAFGVFIAYLWPLLLTTKIRRALRGGPLYAVSLLFVAITIGAACYFGLDLVQATDHRVVYRNPLGNSALYVVPALLAWGASGLAWAGVGAFGSVVAIASAATWGLKPIYAGWEGSTGFWAGSNPSFYGAGAGLIVVAGALVAAQVITLRRAT